MSVGREDRDDRAKPVMSRWTLVTPRYRDFPTRWSSSELVVTRSSRLTDRRYPVGTSALVMGSRL